MISIIIPVYNNHEITTECIYAIIQHTSEYEIVLIDNGSEPAYKPPFTGFNNTKIIRNEENKGFPVAVNQGLRESIGDTIIILNNDVIVTPGWADRLMGGMSLGYDIIGPVTNYCAGLQCVKVGDYNNIDELNYQADEWSNENAGYIQEVNFIIGFCMSFKSSIIEDVGLFDESMWPCSGEEIDFCFRAIEKGYRIGIVHECYIHHEGGMTFKELQDNELIDYNGHIKKVKDHLEKKWGKDYWSRQAIQQPEFDQNMKFTGERAMPLDPDMPVDIMREHLKRYEFILPYIENKTVLDMACGSGYGSNIISDKAKFVIGGDISDEIIQYCKYHYKKNNLRFGVFDIQDMPYPADTFDVIVSFETIEHLSDGNDFLNEVCRVISKNGILIISTPIGGPYGNPYHLSYYQKADLDILNEYFEDIEIFYQDGNGIYIESKTPDYNDTFSGEYAIAICINKKR